MYCAKCRTKILPGQKFCTECGAPVEAQYPLVPQSRSHEAHSGQYAVPTKQRNLFSWFIILVTIVLVELIVLIIIFFNIGKEPKIPTQNEDSVLPSQITPIEKGEPVPIAETTIDTYQSDYVSRANKIAEKEYSKHEKQEAAAAYMQEAMSNNITLDMLNHQPNYYVGKKVYFGGSVSQVIYDPDSPNDCEIRVNVRRTGEPNSHVYVAYTIKSGENRILENDYVDVYGTFLGLVTYETVLGNPITLPGIDAAYVYCTASTDGSVITPTMKEFEALTSGSFISERGEVFSFSTVRNSDDNYFADASDYGDCIVAYYLPIEGWDSSNPPPFYRVTAFRDGTMVIFEPTADADVYAVNDGTYTLFTKTDSVPAPTETHVAIEPSSATATHETIIGYVSPSSGGLKIRGGPFTGYEEVGRLSPGEMVEIYEIDASGSRDWGRIDRGWVCMDYILQEVPSSQSSGGYSAVFEQYKAAISSGYQNCGAYVSDSIVTLRQWGSEFEIRYSEFDMNGDGVDELLIGGRDITSSSDSVIYFDLFTLSGNTPIRIVDNTSLGDRAHLYLYSNGTFAVSGSSGADTYGTEIYRLPAHSAVPTLIEMYGTQDGTPYYAGADGNPSPISEEELDALPKAEEMLFRIVSWSKIST